MRRCVSRAVPHSGCCTESMVVAALTTRGWRWSPSTCPTPQERGPSHDDVSASSTHRPPPVPPAVRCECRLSRFPNATLRRRRRRWPWNSLPREPRRWLCRLRRTRQRWSACGDRLVAASAGVDPRTEAWCAAGTLAGPFMHDGLSAAICRCPTAGLAAAGDVDRILFPDARLTERTVDLFAPGFAPYFHQHISAERRRSWPWTSGFRRSSTG